MEAGSALKEPPVEQDGQENRQAQDSTSPKPDEAPAAIEEPKPEAPQDDVPMEESPDTGKDKSQPAPLVDIQSLERSSIQIFGGQPLSLP